MADAVMWIAWGAPVHGREERAAEVFSESVAYWGELQTEASIETFDVVLLEPYGDLNGFAVLYGTHEQFAELAEDERWIRSTLAASLVVENLRMIEGARGDSLARRMGLFSETASQMPTVPGYEADTGGAPPTAAHHRYPETAVLRPRRNPPPLVRAPRVTEEAQ